MPIIDGYDDTPTGGGDWPDGTYEATITKASLHDGERKDGSKWYAIEIGLETDTGLTRKQRLFYPADTTEWQSWKQGVRSVLKSQLDAIGIHMSELESDESRGRLIGKQITVKVESKNGYTNYYFQAPTQDAVGLPEPVSAGARETIVI